MTQKTKYIILAIVAIFIIIGATLFVSGWFKKSPEKKEYKEAKEQFEKLKEDHAKEIDSLKNATSKTIDSLIGFMEFQEQKILNIKSEQNEIEKEYQKLYGMYVSSNQLDSLRSAFRNKTGG